MELKEFIKHSESLLDRLDEIEKQETEPITLDNIIGYSCYPGLEDLCRDCVHLVYAYDREMPLLEEIKELCKEPRMYAYGDTRWEKFFAQLHHLMRYFIQYLTDFG